MLTDMTRSRLIQIWFTAVALVTVAAARLGSTALLRDDRILRVMIARNDTPTAFVEWVER